MGAAVGSGYARRPIVLVASRCTVACSGSSPLSLSNTLGSSRRASANAAWGMACQTRRSHEHTGQHTVLGGEGRRQYLGTSLAKAF